MRTIFFILSGCVALVLLLSFEARALPPLNTRIDGDSVSGFWYTQGREGGVQLYHCDNKICGRFYWFRPSDTEQLSQDAHNPDPSKRSQPLCQMQFMGDFKPDGQGHYTDGWIYSPRHGQIFNGEMTLIDHDTLNLRGYLVLPVLGENQTWKRAALLPSCASPS